MQPWNIFFQRQDRTLSVQCQQGLLLWTVQCARLRWQCGITLGHCQQDEIRTSHTELKGSLLQYKSTDRSINALFCILLIQCQNQYFTSLIKTRVSFSLFLFSLKHFITWEPSIPWKHGRTQLWSYLELRRLWRRAWNYRFNFCNGYWSTQVFYSPCFNSGFFYSFIQISLFFLGFQIY